MRLIDADALKYKQQVMYKKDGSDDVWAEWFTTATEINNAPTIDAEPVVRCKDCVSFRYSGMGGDNGITYCASMGIEMQPTDFCSYGERKDDD